MCQGRKSGLLGNLGKIQVTFCDQALGVQDAQGIDVLDDGAVGVLLEFMAEIILAHIKFSRDIL